MKGSTISDIAREAGVSKATVSRVLNSTGAVSDATRRRILDVIKRRNYTPSSTARSLSKGTSPIIGFISPEIDNPFFGEILHSATEMIDERGLTMIFYNTDDDAAKDRQALKNLMDHQVAGVLYTPATDYSDPEERDQLRRQLQGLNVPVVIMDRNIGFTDFDTVHFNDYQGMYDATERLIQAGHEKIGIVNGTLDRVLARERQRGYLDALNHRGIAPRDDYMFYGDYHSERAYELSKRLLAMPDRPTAVLTCNNRTTVGFLRALYERDEKLGEDIACVGLDRIEVLDRIHMPLNYIERDSRQMGREAAKLLFSRLDFPRRPRTELILNTRVVAEYL